jgi:hypothetical protein
LLALPLQVARSLITITSSDGEKLQLFKEIAGVLAGLQQVRGAGATRRHGQARLLPDT